MVYASPWGVLPAGATPGCAPPWAALTIDELVTFGASEQGYLAHEAGWVAVLPHDGDWAAGQLAPLTTSARGDRGGCCEYASKLTLAEWCAAYYHPAADEAQ